MIINKDMLLFSDEEKVSKIFRMSTMMFFAVLITMGLSMVILKSLDRNTRPLGDFLLFFIFINFFGFVYLQYNYRVLLAINKKIKFEEYGKCIKDSCDLSLGNCINNDEMGIWICPNYEFEGKQQILEILNKING